MFLAADNRNRSEVGPELFGSDAVRMRALRNQAVHGPSAVASLSQLLVLRFLMRYGSVRRSALFDKLDRLALRISDGNHGALTFQWAELRPEQLPWAAGSQLGLGLRELNALKNALHSMLREGVSNGVVDHQMYFSIVKHDCAGKRAGRDRRTLEPGAIVHLIETCFHEHSAESIRDAALIGLLWEKAITIAEAIELPWTGSNGVRGCIHLWGRKRINCVRSFLGLALDQWMSFRPAEERPLLLSIDSAHRVLSRGMTRLEAAKAVAARARNAGLGVLSAEDLRYSSLLHTLSDEASGPSSDESA